MRIQQLAVASFAVVFALSIVSPPAPRIIPTQEDRSQIVYLSLTALVDTVRTRTPDGLDPSAGAPTIAVLDSSSLGGAELPASVGGMTIRSVSQREANEGNVTRYYAFDRLTVASDSAETTIIDYDRAHDVTALRVYVSLSRAGDSWRTDYVRVEREWPYPKPPDESVRFTYGAETSLASATSVWASDRSSSILAPTWLPDGISLATVYLRRADPITDAGPGEQVTLLYSYNTTTDPRTAELTVRVCPTIDIPWLVPRDGEGIGSVGNYTTVSGLPAYFGTIGWSEGDYNRLYGSSARFVSVVYGDYIYLIRGPVGFSYEQLLKVAGSLQPVG